MNYTMTLEEFNQLEEGTYTLLDVRGEIAYNHGHIPSAQLFELATMDDQIALLEEGKKVIVYCIKGLVSNDVVEKLRDKGFEAYNLKDGYGKWLISNFDDDSQRTKDIERSIQKKFHKQLLSKFAKAIKTYELLEEGDKVAICISGGKDSMVMAKLFQELKRHKKFHFDLVFLMMDPGYDDYNREIVDKNCQLLDIPVTVFHTDIFDAVFNIEKSPCYLCARMRRGYLYSKAKALGCNKIALGHHFDDVIETNLMSMLYGAQVQSMMPKLHSTNFEGMELIRPMYLIREDDIKHWREYNNLQFIQCACRFTDTCSTDGGNTGSKRAEVKHLIKTMKESNPYVESNIFKSMENVQIDTVVAYKTKGEKKHFLDTY